MENGPTEMYSLNIFGTCEDRVDKHWEHKDMKMDVSSFNCEW